MTDSAAGNTAGVAHGDRVRINYRLTLEDGTEVDSSNDDGPLDMVVGDGTLLDALEAVLIGMVAGEMRVQTIPCEHGFGQHQPELHHRFAHDEFPADIEPVVGAVMSFSMAGGDEIPGTVTAISDAGVEVDLNHPLAGRTVVFQVELVPTDSE